MVLQWNEVRGLRMSSSTVCHPETRSRPRLGLPLPMYQGATVAQEDPSPRAAEGPAPPLRSCSPGCARDLADTGRVLHDALPSAPTPAPPYCHRLGAGLLRFLCQGGGMGWGTQGSVDDAQC
ncbi:unnamed protein product [Arctogadus glacialis]